jgi:hypothetical protein
MNEKDPDWWGKCRCWRPGWMGQPHDDPNCEFLLEERKREQEQEQKKKTEQEGKTAQDLKKE